MPSEPDSKSATWSTVHGDMSDVEWEFIADLVAPYSGGGRMGRPVSNDRRAIVDAIFFVTSTGCQWRALPSCYPKWSTVHHYHITWSRDGTWERIAGVLRDRVRVAEGRDPEPSAGIIDARTVRGAATVTSETRGYDAGKKISGRKTFGLIDTMGSLMAVAVFPASVSDNVGGIAVFDIAREKSGRLKKVWTDGGFKAAFKRHCNEHHVSAVVVNRIHRHEFVVLPKRWMVERTWSWLMNNRRLQIDYERDPKIAEGFVWAAQVRLLLRRLTAQ